jgi:hypothetical protein
MEDEWLDFEKLSSNIIEKVFQRLRLLPAPPGN